MQEAFMNMLLILGRRVFAGGILHDAASDRPWLLYANPPLLQALAYLFCLCANVFYLSTYMGKIQGEEDKEGEKKMVGEAPAKAQH